MQCHTIVLWVLFLGCVRVAHARSYFVLIMTGFYDTNGWIETRLLGEKGATSAHVFVPPGKVLKKDSKYHFTVSNAADVGKVTGISIYLHGTGSGRNTMDINRIVVGSNGLYYAFLNDFKEIPSAKWTSIGAKCPYGLELGPQGNCVDKDECKTTCNGKLAVCTNTIGSYKCECPRGYRRAGNWKDCEDINECLHSKECSGYCVNTQGSYKCECQEGYEVVDGTKCADIDECKDGSHNCDRESTYCSNVKGGFYCYCNPGYQRVNSTHCEVHYCGGLSHYANKKTTLVPLRCLRDKANRYRNNCTMVCKYGYEITDPTYVTVTCGKDGLWNGGFSYCRGVKCPPLTSPPNANTYPSSCRTEGGRYDSSFHCRQYCNNGYRRVRGGILVCQANATWSGLPVECKKVYPAPRVSCPSSVFVTLPPGKNTTSLGSKWELPKSNVKNLTVLPPGANQFYQFPSGETKVIWTATNPEGLTDTCLYYVRVDDKEPPKVTFCPGPKIFQAAYTSKVYVKYKRPTFTDNVGVTRVTPGYTGGVEVSLGSVYQYFTASDKAGNRATCKFVITTGGRKCSLTPDGNLKNWRFTNFGGTKYAIRICPNNTQTYGTYYFSFCSESVGKWGHVGDCVAYIAANITTKCPLGFGRSSAVHQAGFCFQCPLGHYYKDVSGNDTCVQCDAGTYQDQRGSTSCKACPQGTSSLQGDHVCRDLCPRGTFSKDGMRPFCGLCPQGRYQPKQGQTSCLVCPNNKFTNTKLGSYSCGDVEPPTSSQDLPVIERVIHPDVLNTTTQEAANVFECYIKANSYDQVAVKWEIEDNGIPADFLGSQKHEEISNAAGKPIGARLTITRTQLYNAEVKYVCNARNPNGQTKRVVTVKSDH